MSTELDDRQTLTNRSIVAVPVALAGVLLLGGCQPASTPPANAGLDASSTTAQRLDAAPDDQTDQSLLSQAQQDVEFFLNQRNAAESDGHEEPAATETDLSTDRAQQNDSGAPVQIAAIQWNEQVRPARTTPAAHDAALRKLDSPADQTAERDAASGASGGQETERPIVNHPLARPETVSGDRPTTADALHIDRTRQLIVDLSGSLYRDAERSDEPMRELMLLAATALIAPDRKINAQGIASLTPEDRETLNAMQEFFASLGSRLGSAESNDVIARDAVEQLQQALDRRPPFGITTATLCTGVRGFGNYDEFEKLSFLAHREQQAIVYMELEHFTSELNANSEWVTELAQELVIYSSHDGIAVWSEAWQSVVDVTRNKRQDFFTVQLVTLPKALSVGRYHLKIRIRDEATGAMAERSIPFEMVADARMAAPVR